MDETLKKCIISRYDKTITKPPYLTIPFDEIEIIKPEIDNLGEQFAINIEKACRNKGYSFQFYTVWPDLTADYEIIVH